MTRRALIGLLVCAPLVTATAADAAYNPAFSLTLSDTHPASAPERAVCIADDVTVTQHRVARREIGERDLVRLRDQLGGFQPFRIVKRRTVPGVDGLPMVSTATSVTL